MTQAKQLPEKKNLKPSKVTFGVFACCDPRIDRESRDRTRNIVEILAEIIAKEVKMPDGSAVNVVWA